MIIPAHPSRRMRSKQRLCGCTDKQKASSHESCREFLYRRLASSSRHCCVISAKCLAAFSTQLRLSRHSFRRGLLHLPGWRGSRWGDGWLAVASTALWSRVHMKWLVQRYGHLCWLGEGDGRLGSLQTKLQLKIGNVYTSLCSPVHLETFHTLCQHKAAMGLGILYTILCRVGHICYLWVNPIVQS